MKTLPLAQGTYYPGQRPLQQVQPAPTFLQAPLIAVQDNLMEPRPHQLNIPLRTPLLFTTHYQHQWATSTTVTSPRQLPNPSNLQRQQVIRRQVTMFHLGTPLEGTILDLRPTRCPSSLSHRPTQCTDACLDQRNRARQPRSAAASTAISDLATYHSDIHISVIAICTFPSVEAEVCYNIQSRFKVSQ